MLVVFYHVALIMLPALFFVEGRVLRLVPEVLQFYLKEFDGLRTGILLQFLAGLPDSVLLRNRQVVGLEGSGDVDGAQSGFAGLRGEEGQETEKQCEEQTKPGSRKHHCY